MDRFFDNQEQMLLCLMWLMDAPHLRVSVEEGDQYVLSEVVGDYWDDVFCGSPEQVIEQLVSRYREFENQPVDLDMEA